MRPKILLSLGAKHENYVNAVKKVGGDPLAAYLPAADTGFDGLILGGGPDIHPKYFREEINGSENIDTARDEAEFLLADAFVRAGKPIMGICRGAQLLNVYFGGALFQHIETAESHRSHENIDLVHTVLSEEGSLVYDLYGKEFSVNSYHHQAISIAGKELKITAREKKTGIAEAFEHSSLPVWGFQWHPERMCFLNARPDTVDGAAVFDGFIKTCGR